MKYIKGYEKRYSVTKEGRIYHHKWKFHTGKGFKILKNGYSALWKNARGYLYVSLRKGKERKTIGVHRLVAQTYLPNPNNLPQINHKNGIKIDNRVENLEWCTPLHNTRHSFEIGLNKSYGEKCHKAKLSIGDVREIVKRRNKGETIKSLGGHYKVNRTTISSIMIGKSWKRVTGF